MTRDANFVAAQMAVIARLVARSEKGTTFMVSDDAIMSTIDDKRGELLVPAQVMASRLPPAALPMIVSSEGAGDVSISIGGFSPEGCDPEDIQVIIEAAHLVEECTPRAERIEEAERFSIHRPGAGSSAPVMTPWARSPTEAALKFLISQVPEYIDNKDVLLASDPIGDLKLEMRTQSGWEKHDLRDHLARARDAIALHFEAAIQIDPESDSLPDPM